MAHHILLVEDNSMHRSLGHKILVELGYNVTSVDNAFAALSKLADNPRRYALVIMDVEMPEMNGLEAVRSIRAHQEKDGWPHIPVVAFTGNKQPGDKEACLAAGMDDYMAKEIFMPKWRESLSEKLDLWLHNKDSSISTTQTGKIHDL